MSVQDRVRDVIHLIESLTPEESETLRSVINQKISQIVSEPFPEETKAQLHLCTSLINLQRTLITRSWPHAELKEGIKAIGCQLLRDFFRQDDTEKTLQDYHDGLEILQLIRDIKHHCPPITISPEVALEARKHNMIGSLMSDARRLLCQRMTWQEHGEESFNILKAVAQLRKLIEASGSELDCAYMPGLNSIIERLASNIAANFEMGYREEGKEELEAETVKSETPAEPEATSPSTTASSIKEERPASPTSANIPDHEPSAPSSIASLFAERAALHEARQREKKLTDLKERKAQALAQKEAIAKDPTRAEQQKYVKEVEEQLKKDKVEREKILARINDDKMVRKEKAEQTKMKRMWAEEAKKQKEEEGDGEVEVEMEDAASGS